jgi:hypothetical protein
METINAPGGTIIFGQPAEEYFANPAIGRTDVMKIRKSPAKFKAEQDAKERRAEREEEEEGGDDA